MDIFIRFVLVKHLNFLIDSKQLLPQKMFHRNSGAPPKTLPNVREVCDDRK